MRCWTPRICIWISRPRAATKRVRISTWPTGCGTTTATALLDLLIRGGDTSLETPLIRAGRERSWIEGMQNHQRMGDGADHTVRETVDTVYRTDARPVLATLIRLLGDFDLAEEALHDAFTAAVQQWPRDGVPVNPRAWLVSTGRFKAIDGLRRRARFNALLTERAGCLDANTHDAAGWDDEGINDDQLRLIFACCHPALPPDAQVALTLRE